MSRYLVSSSPHIASSRTTRNIMLDVIIALMPAVIAMVAIFGFYPLLNTLVCVGFCVLFEFLFNLIRKKEQTVGDLSAIVTGIILGLNLPAVVPIYVPVVGALFAIVIAKMLFGGIGRNFANPAISARIFLLLAWTSVMTSFVAPLDWSNLAENNMFFTVSNVFNIKMPDLVTSATPLAHVKEALELGVNPATGINALDMFLGTIGGSAGEVSALAILIGGIYLLIRKVIDWKIPLIYILSTVIFTAIFYSNTGYVGEYVWTYLLGGGLLFGAFFMATDYATSPKSPIAVIIYGIGLGLLTVIIRKFSSMSEGVSYAILLMNIVTPLLDKIKVKPFGGYPAYKNKDFVDASAIKGRALGVWNSKENMLSDLAKGIEEGGTNG